ncbi:hypothetical protein [Argonema galeatum]|uniref:hypothetical protein n=1 Tax=Argonema galeatum TaxID=2942762 RepID=UPI00201135BA|nr:hypothetical protein [Argonema galeatum]MCL1464348.1 hypothetical protein [Argonema galeatum A003/A1]
MGQSKGDRIFIGFENRTLHPQKDRNLLISRSRSPICYTHDRTLVREGNTIAFPIPKKPDRTPHPQKARLPTAHCANALLLFNQS